MRKELRYDEACGCGSRLPYGQCCKKEQVAYTRDGRGSVFKSIKLDDEGLAAIGDAQARFREVFGRKPQRKDRILTDSYAYSQADLDRDMMEAFSKSGMPKQIAYAYAETGILVSEQNAAFVAPVDLDAWTQAIERYSVALADGIDLLAADNGPVTSRLEEFATVLRTIVIHLGSYADRSPRETEKSAPTFFQFLLIGKAHQCAKALSKGWRLHLKNETFSLLRSVYECALLIRRLHEDGQFANTLFAQALVGRGPFTYKQKKNGDLDFSKIINTESGDLFDARTSYFECAKIASEDESAFFEVVYPFLSSNIHFDASDFIDKFRKSGSFLIWETADYPTQAIFIMAVFSYLIISLNGSGGFKGVLRKDSKNLLDKMATCFYGLYIALDDEDRHVDEHTSLVVFTADRLFRGESLSKTP